MDLLSKTEKKVPTGISILSANKNLIKKKYPTKNFRNHPFV